MYFPAPPCRRVERSPNASTFPHAFLYSAVSISRRRLRRRGPRSLHAFTARRVRASGLLESGSSGSQSLLPDSGCGEPQPQLFADPVSHPLFLHMLLINIRSIRPHAAELTVVLQDLKPHIVFLTETWLDDSCVSFPIAGYHCICRRDRGHGQIGGGVAVYARVGFESVSLLEYATDAERAWHVLTH